ncbi:MAG: AAA family ATPase [Spirulina sp. SIO3F2]|nr:AAA family ATPase [Spirulina sp. SIO3F2]
MQSKAKLDDVGGLAALAQLVSSTVGSCEVEPAAKQLRELAERRRLINLGYLCQQLGHDRLRPLGSIMAKLKETITPFMEESMVVSENELDNMRCERLINQVRDLILSPDLTPAQRKYRLHKLSKRTGYSVPELKDFYHASLIEGENEQAMTIAQLREQYGDQITEWVAHGWFPRGRTTLLHAEGGTGKTLWAYDFIFHLVTGTDWEGFPVLGEKKVLIIQSDESPADLLQNLEARGFDPDCENLRIKTRWDVSYIPQLYEECKEWQPDFILIDSLSSISAKSCISENDKEYARPVLELVDVAKQTNCHIMLIHHSSRMHGQSRGSTAIPAAVSQVLSIKRVSENIDDTRRHITFTKSRSRRPAKYEIVLNPETKSWTLEGEVNREDTEAPLKERVIEFLRTHPGERYTRFELSELLYVNENTLQTA